MRKTGLKKITICRILVFALLFGNFISVMPGPVQAKTYDPAGEWRRVEKSGTQWLLSISMFTSDDSDRLAGSCTFSCTANLGPRYSNILWIEGDVYRISANKYKCRFSDPYNGQSGSFIIKLTSNKKLKLIKTKTTERIINLNPSGKYKLTQRYMS